MTGSLLRRQRPHVRRVTGTITQRADGAELMTITLGRNPQVLADLPRLTPGEHMPSS